MAADKSFSDIDLAEFQTPNRRASGLIKGAEAFHRISDEPEPEDAFMPALGLSPIKEYVEGKSGMLSIPDPKKIFTKCLDMIGGEDAVVANLGRPPMLNHGRIIFRPCVDKFGTTAVKFRIG